MEANQLAKHGNADARPGNDPVELIELRRLFALLLVYG
jgi:hypothetical protein